MSFTTSSLSSTAAISEQLIQNLLMPTTKVEEQMMVAGSLTPQPTEDIVLTIEAVQLVGAANAFYPGLEPQDQGSTQESKSRINIST